MDSLPRINIKEGAATLGAQGKGLTPYGYATTLRPVKGMGTFGGTAARVEGSERVWIEERV